MSKMSYQNIGRSDGDMDLSEMKCFGNKVLIKKHETYHERNIGGIHILYSNDLSARMNKGTIVSLGDISAKLTGLKVGDVVLYDHMATYYDFKTYAVVATKEADDTILAKVIEE